MSNDPDGPFDQPTWTDSDAFEEVFMMWRVRSDLGLVVVPDEPGSEPRVIFCNLSDDWRMFMSGLDRPEASMTLTQARAVLDEIERCWVRRKGPIGPLPQAAT